MSEKFSFGNFVQKTRDAISSRFSSENVRERKKLWAEFLKRKENYAFVRKEQRRGDLAPEGSETVIRMLRQEVEELKVKYKAVGGHPDDMVLHWWTDDSPPPPPPHGIDEDVRR